MPRLYAFLTLVLLPLWAFSEEQPRQRISFFLDRAIPHIAVGGPQWQTTFIFHNPSAQREKFYINFRGDSGNSVAIPVLGGTYSSVLVTLPPRSTVKLVSDYRPDLPTISGSAYLSDACSDCHFDYTTVHTIFALYDWEQRKFLCEATVPQESPYENDVALIYDQEGNYVMGVALMNPSTYETKSVIATVFDKNNQLLRTEQFNMNPLTHQAFVLKDRYPETAGRLGYVKFSTTGIGGIAGTGLRFSPNGTFTSMHLVSLDMIDLF